MRSCKRSRTCAILGHLGPWKQPILSEKEQWQAAVPSLPDSTARKPGGIPAPAPSLPTDASFPEPFNHLKSNASRSSFHSCSPSYRRGYNSDSE